MLILLNADKLDLCIAILGQDIIFGWWWLELIGSCNKRKWWILIKPKKIISDFDKEIKATDKQK